MSANIRNRAVSIGLFAVIVAAIFYFDLARFLSLQALQDNEAVLRAWTERNPLGTALVYVTAYIVVVAFSIPGALWMTLTGGFLFGTAIGGLLAISGATLGAVALFVMAKYVIGDFFRTRYGPRLVAFEAGFNRDAASYLLSMRLIPVFPFFLVNLGAALMKVRLTTFFLTTFFGIMPGGFVFASIGNGIGFVLQSGQTPDLSLASQPQVTLPLIGLGVLTLLPALIKRWKSRKRGGVSQEETAL